MWHRGTGLFAKTIYDRIALINNHWDHFELIQKVESGTFKLPVVKNVSPIAGYYVHFPAPSTNKIVNIMELNGPTSFHPLVKKGVDVHAYKKGEILDTTSQKVPDNVFDFSKSSFTNKRIHGMDDKAYENPRDFTSKIFTRVSIEKYKEGLNGLENMIATNILDINKERMVNIAFALKELKRTSNDFVEHQIVWATHLHHFPKEYIPALRIYGNFSLKDITPAFNVELQKSTLRMQKISNRLYEKKVPENDYKKAIEFFEDSVIQKSFEET